MICVSWYLYTVYIDDVTFVNDFPCLTPYLHRNRMILVLGCFDLVYMQTFGRMNQVPLSSAWLPSKMAGDNNKNEVNPGAPEVVYMELG